MKINLSYKTAKSLKDSGFPQDYRDHVIADAGDMVSRLMDEHSAKEMGYEYAALPTLADDFVLSASDGQESEWEARLMYHGYFDGWPGIKRDDDGFVAIDMACGGDTMDEAVANLYLNLNT